jgi:hypothetical protein
VAHLVQGTNPGRDEIFSSPKLTAFRAQPAPCSMCTGAPALGVQWPGHNVKHSSPSNAEVRNEWNYTSTLPVCLHGVNRENITFTFIAMYVMG